MGTVVFEEISELDSACQRNFFTRCPTGTAIRAARDAGRAGDFDHQPQSRRGNARGTFSQPNCTTG